MLKCQKCEAVYEEPVYHYEDDTGYGYYTCPECGYDEYDEVAECVCCGEFFEVDDLWSGFCDGCLEKEADYCNAVDFGMYVAKQSQGINDFYLYVIGEENVNHMLSLAMHNKRSPDYLEEDAKNYCLEDRSSFADWLLKNGGYEK